VKVALFLAIFLGENLVWLDYPLSLLWPGVLSLFNTKLFFYRIR
jgi:hypothetical protein